MAGFVSVVPFQLANASGNQTITDPRALGMVPTAVMLIVGGATALDTITSTARISVGMTDGTTSRSVGFMAENGAVTAVADTGWRTDTGSVMQLPGTSSEGLDTSATWVSFGVDSVTLNFDQARQFRGQVVLIYGSIGVDVQSFACSASIGGTVTKTLSFTPDFLIAVGVGQAFSSLGAGAPGMLCRGFAARLPSVTQGCSAVCAEDQAVSATSVGLIARNDCLLTTISSSAGTVTEGTRWEASFGTNSYTITTRNAAVAVEGMVLAFSFDGAKGWAGCNTVAAGSTGNKALTDAGFKPKAVLLNSLRVAVVNTIGSTASQGNMCLGGVDASGSQSAIAVNSQDNISSSLTQSEASASHVVTVPITSSTRDWLASFVSMDAGGWTLNVDSAAGGNRQVAYLAIGEQLKTTPGQSQPGQVSEMGLAPAQRVPFVAGHAASGPGGVQLAPGALTSNPAALAPSAPFGHGASPPSTTPVPGQATASVFGTPAPSSAPAGFTPPPVVGSVAVSQPVPSSNVVVAQAQQAASVGGRIFHGMGAVYRALQRWRIESFYSLFAPKPVEKASESDVPPPPQFAIRTANARGWNALAGSEAGDNSVAGSERGA